MCLTTEALMLFIGMLPAHIVDVSDDRIVVRAEVRDAVWQVKGDQWCTNAPKIDAAFRLKQGSDA
ncbi:hypothetical protein [Psychromarinibacter halotolerans]|uniref:Uncharacterized protein n=1 Tax=Psychromarinibacter halotolerans TaxID=1775175 RepID=A0ABV7GTP1_9RHOB|nr:hypothetical protein [Psychromarinibacter halotolerans]MAQ81933.1 hypothetical protein [Maritimibacter sp.]MDF0594443.1 hypothetical protein [Psychromarinibacter halotolerans]